jgi:hypothetical protein
MFLDMEKANAIASKPGSLQVTNCSCRVQNPEGAYARLPQLPATPKTKGPGMRTLRALTRMMERYNRAVAPGSNCAAWQLFIEACRYDLHRLPWSESAELVAPEGFAQYWTHVALGESLDFDAESGDCSVAATQVRLGNLIDVCPTNFAAESLPSFALSLMRTESNSRNFASEG